MMKTPMFLATAIAVVVLMGYGERCEATDINAFVEACLSSYNWEEPLCECVAEKADERLTPNGFAFLVAIMNNDEAKAAELRNQLDMNEKLESGMFMVNTPQECSEELEGN